jgi:hypothetical protein
LDDEIEFDEDESGITKSWPSIMSRRNRPIADFWDKET